MSFPDSDLLSKWLIFKYARIEVAPRKRIEIQGLVDGRQLRFRSRGFADVQGAAIGALEGGRDALLHGQDLPQTTPAALDVVFLQVLANDLHELVSQDGDEQVAVNTYFFMVVDRAQAEFRFETTEYGNVIHGLGIIHLVTESSHCLKKL